MIEDKEGFVYPHVDDMKCVDCGLCVKTCSYISYSPTVVANKPATFLYAYNIDNEVLLNSSSGGIFWPIVNEVISHNGVVYGAVCGKNFEVYHCRGESLKECFAFRKSKYLQSDTKQTYEECLADLKKGKLVLYSGTPCQIAGLYSYIMRT